jgi:hypothetical protein
MINLLSKGTRVRWTAELFWLIKVHVGSQSYYMRKVKVTNLSRTGDTWVRQSSSICGRSLKHSPKGVYAFIKTHKGLWMHPILASYLYISTYIVNYLLDISSTCNWSLTFVCNFLSSLNVLPCVHTTSRSSDFKNSAQSFL